jgi:hypothetical protein
MWGCQGFEKYLFVMLPSEAVDINVFNLFRIEFKAIRWLALWPAE